MRKKLDKNELYEIFPKAIEPAEWLRTMVRQEAAVVQDEILEKLRQWDLKLVHFRQQVNIHGL